MGRTAGEGVAREAAQGDAVVRGGVAFSPPGAGFLALAAPEADRRRMASCEVCSTLGWPQKGPGKRVLLGERLVTLCASHARVLPSLPKAGVDELRQAFKEKLGKRSLIDRRQDLDRRVFPARPEGRRRGQDRRTTDSRG